MKSKQYYAQLILDLLQQASIADVEEDLDCWKQPKKIVLTYNPDYKGYTIKIDSDLTGMIGVNTPIHHELFRLLFNSYITNSGYQIKKINKEKK